MVAGGRRRKDGVERRSWITLYTGLTFSSQFSIYLIKFWFLRSWR